MYFARAHARKIPERDLALQATHDRDDAQKHKAAANMPRKNWTALSGPMRPTEFPERASRGSNAWCGTERLLPAMFPVSVSWVEIPFVSGGIRISNASKVPKRRFTREEKLWSPICAGRKRGKKSRILREFVKMPRDHDCFLSKVPSPLLTRRAIVP
jgi:hypothetical protein